MVILTYEEWKEKEVMPQFFVIAGKKQSGKTTAAKYIESRTHLAKVVSFADPIKDFCRNIFGFTQEQIAGTNEQKNSPTFVRWENMPDDIQIRYGTRNIGPDIVFSLEHISRFGLLLPKTGRMTAREVMQIFGTDIIRNYFGQNIWAELPFKRYYDTLHRCIIIDDCRFPNEADIALKNRAILIRLTRNVLGPDQHTSETALDIYPIEKYTYVIDNQDMTIKETQVALKEILDATSD